MRIVPGTLNGFIAAIIDIPVTYAILAISFYFRFYSELIVVSKESQVLRAIQIHSG